MIPQHSGGGADGSIMIFNDTESKNGANRGLDPLIRILENILAEYNANDPHVVVSPGDMWVLVHSPAARSDISLVVSNLLLPLGSPTVPVLPGCHFSSVVLMQQYLLHPAWFLAHPTRSMFF
jgi:hypothetical protein